MSSATALTFHENTQTRPGNGLDALPTEIKLEIFGHLDGYYDVDPLICASAAYRRVFQLYTSSIILDSSFFYGVTVRTFMNWREAPISILKAYRAALKRLQELPEEKRPMGGSPLQRLSLSRCEIIIDNHIRVAEDDF